jgi:hypothetical protein
LPDHGLGKGDAFAGLRGSPLTWIRTMFKGCGLSSALFPPCGVYSHRESSGRR